MLRLTIPAAEMWDDQTETFSYAKEQTIQLEHSLVSLSKWESKWGKAFLTKANKTYEETIDYIKCMTITQNVDPNSYYRLTKKQIDEVNRYIEAPMTATTVSFYEDKKGGRGGREIVTSELIYYWMIALNIPFECQKWHLNRLLMLVKVCNAKNQPPKKMSQRDTMAHYAALNAARRKKHNSRG